MTRSPSKIKCEQDIQNTASSSLPDPYQSFPDGKHIISGSIVNIVVNKVLNSKYIRAVTCTESCFWNVANLHATAEANFSIAMQANNTNHGFANPPQTISLVSRYTWRACTLLHRINDMTPNEATSRIYFCLLSSVVYSHGLNGDLCKTVTLKRLFPNFWPSKWQGLHSQHVYTLNLSQGMPLLSFTKALGSAKSVGKRCLTCTNRFW